MHTYTNTPSHLSTLHPTHSLWHHNNGHSTPQICAYASKKGYILYICSGRVLGLGVCDLCVRWGEGEKNGLYEARTHNLCGEQSALYKEVKISS